MTEEIIDIDNAPRLPGVDYASESWVIDGVQYTIHEDAEAAHVAQAERLTEGIA